MDDISLTQAEYELLLRGHTWIRSVDPYTRLSRGWAGIIVAMLDVLHFIMDEITSDHPHARVIDFDANSKMGCLRVRFALAGVSDPHDAVWRLLRAVICRAEQKSTRTCEQCGAPARLRDGDEWLMTLCDAHAAKELCQIPVEWPVAVSNARDR